MNETLTLLTYLFQTVASSIEGTINPLGRPLGLIIVGIIEFPVLILFIAALLGKPRSNKITILFIGWVLVMFSTFIGSVFFLSYLLGIFY